MKFIAAAVAAVVIAGSTLLPASAYSAPLVATSGVSALRTADTDVPELAPVALPTADPGRPAAPPRPASAGGPALLHPSSSPDGSGTDTVGAVTIHGTVRFGLGEPGRAVAGVTVTTTRVDTNDTPLETTEVTTSADGGYLFSGLADGRYWVSFYYDGDPAGDTAMWWGATPQNPFGNDAVALRSGQKLTADQLVMPTGTVAGGISNGDTGAAPDPTGIQLYLTVRDESDGLYYPVLRVGWDDAGHYENHYTLLFADYALFAINRGAGASYAAQSASQGFAVGANQTSKRDTIVVKLITAVDGVDAGTDAVVNALYWDFLTRAPGASDVAYWSADFTRGADLGDVSAGFVNSDEYRLIRIDAAYRSILGREPDARGRSDWLANMRAGRITTDDIETSFYASAEYLADHGGTNVSFAEALYGALLHRTGSPSDWKFWGDLARKNGRDWVIQQFWREPETIGERVTLMYAKYLGRTPDAEGLRNWVGVALAIGDSGLRSGLTGNTEYDDRSQRRFAED